jgi:hypothetical protein
LAFTPFTMGPALGVLPVFKSSTFALGRLIFTGGK